MSRLIDADALKSELDSWTVNLLNPKYYVREDALLIIDSAPTVDPVRHGRWVRFDESQYYRCSRCGTGMCIVKTPYCQQCGLKMDLPSADEGGKAE